MNYLANKELCFHANRYEEWAEGKCLSQGPLDATIVAELSNNTLHCTVKGAESLRMYPDEIYTLAGESGDLGDRIQYVSPNINYDPLEPIVFQVFHAQRTINYLRFAMTAPDRIIEFYGELIAFDGTARPENPQRLKSSFIDELASLYRYLLKENTVSIYIMQHQMACVAFSLKKYYSLLAMMKDPDGKLKQQVFKDTSSIISQYFPIFGNEALDDARNWYNQIVANPFHSDVFLEYYFGEIAAGEDPDCGEIMRAFQLH